MILLRERRNFIKHTDSMTNPDPSNTQQEEDTTPPQMPHLSRNVTPYSYAEVMGAQPPASNMNDLCDFDPPQ